MDRVNVLLIEDDAEEVALLREALDKESAPPFSVHWSGLLEMGLERLARARYEIVLLDLSLPDSFGLEAFARLLRVAPNIPVIVLGGAGEESLLLRAVRAGAEDYIVKGAKGAEGLARAVRCALERRVRRVAGSQRIVRGRRRKARTIGFIGGKGGVGTTTVALNVGAALAAGKRKTVVAEIRGYHGTVAQNLKRVSVHGNLSALLGLTPEAINEVEINARLARYSSELSLLCGPQRASETRPCTASHVRSVIEGLKGMAEFLVLDLPPEPCEAIREAARQADFIGLVVDREETCVASARLMADHLRSWKTEALIGLVVVHRSPLACPVELEVLERELQLETMELIPPAADSCVMAASAGVPLVEAYGETLVSASLQELAAKLSSDPIVVRRSA